MILRKRKLPSSLMERYELLGLVGEGSYGTVMKCRHRDTSRLVAIKKFVDPDDDKTVKKIALREIKLLRQLRHDNLVNLLEVWRHRRHWYLVFEFVDRTLLDELEKNPNGLDLNTSRLYLFQILRAAAFCHQQHVIHRDIKPENILLSQGDVLKLCDFGFARTVTSPAEEGAYTDYVATRWYRAPELLVGDTKYGRPVDVWAVGCLTMEMLTGQPLFPGDSDLDQIYQIIRCVGNLTAHHQEMFHRNPVFSGVSLPECSGRVPLEQRFSTIPPVALGLAQSCLQMDPEKRSECSELLGDPLFTQDSFHIRVLEELNAKILKDHRENSTLPKIVKTPRPEVNEGDVKIQKAKDKKQSKDMEGKINKEQDKRSKDREEEKIQKVNPSNPTNPTKIIGTTSENPFPAKLSKGLGSKNVDNTAKATTAISKAGKATHTELRKGAEYFKLTKTRTSDSLETFKTHLKDNNPMSALPKCGKAVSPQLVECHSKHKDTKDRDSTGLDCSVMEVTPLSKSDPSQDLGRSCNTLNPKESKVFKRRTSDFPNPGSPSKIYLKQNTKPSDTKLTEETGENFPKEHSDGSPVTLKCDKLKRVQAEATLSRGTCDVCVNITKPTIPSVAKAAKTTKKALPSNLRPPGATSNSGPTRTKNNTTSGGSAQPSCSSDSTTTLPVESPQNYSSKATKDTTHVPHNPPEDLPNDKEHTEASKHQQDSWIPSSISNLHRCLKMSPLTTTAANHSETSHVMRDYKQYSQLCSTHQQTTKEYRRTSTSMPSQTSKTNMTKGTKIPNTLEVLIKENRTDFFESITPPTISFSDQTSKSCRSSDAELKSKTIEAGPNMKSSVELMFESLSHFNKPITTQKTITSTDDQNDKSNPEMRNKATTSLTSTAIRENQAAMRRSRKNKLGFSSSYCASHPAPVSSTPTISTLSVIIANIPSTSGHLTQEPGLYPGSQSIRCDDRPMHCGVNHCPTVKKLPRGHIMGQLTPQSAKVAERSQIGQCSCSIGITSNGKKSDLQDRRGPTLPELRGQEGKITRGTSLDQKKCKQPDLPLEPQHNGRNSVDST